MTFDPTLTGVVTDGATASGLPVQVDTNGDGYADGNATTDANGGFTWTPTRLTPGR